MSSHDRTRTKLLELRPKARAPITIEPACQYAVAVIACTRVECECRNGGQYRSLFERSQERILYKVEMTRLEATHQALGICAIESASPAGDLLDLTLAEVSLRIAVVLGDIGKHHSSNVAVVQRVSTLAKFMRTRRASETTNVQIQAHANGIRRDEYRSFVSLVEDARLL